MSRSIERTFIITDEVMSGIMPFTWTDFRDSVAVIHLKNESSLNHLNIERGLSLFIEL
jgi:hypothetical protein